MTESESIIGTLIPERVKELARRVKATTPNNKEEALILHDMLVDEGQDYLADSLSACIWLSPYVFSDMHISCFVIEELVRRSTYEKVDVYNHCSLEDAKKDFPQYK